MEEILNTIKIINDTYEKCYVYYHPAHTNKSAKKTFMNGYCYEYYKILKFFYPKAILVIQNDKMHTACLINNDIYDASGKRTDNYNFHIATGSDIEYIYKYYAKFSVGFNDYLFKNVIKDVYDNKKEKMNSNNVLKLIRK